MKELMVGAGVAAALGLYLGDLAQPQLALDRPEPMQPATALFTEWSDTAPAVYAARVPDHVLGSDWLLRNQTVAVPEVRAEPAPTSDEIEWAYEERTFAESAAPSPDAPPPAAPTYPSVDGDILAGMRSAEAPDATDPSPDV